MRVIITFFLLSGCSHAVESEHLRSSVPRDCFLYSWEKGPHWTAPVSTEFRLALLATHSPMVSEQYTEPTGDAFSWGERDGSPSTKTIATINGRKVVEVIYPVEGLFGRKIGFVMLAIETVPDTEWFSPFFAASPELYEGVFVHSKDVPFGYTVTLSWSGTGAFRTHRLFDLTATHPSIVATVSAGRVRSIDFKTKEAYEKALEVFDEEEALLRGELPADVAEEK